MTEDEFRCRASADQPTEPPPRANGPLADEEQLKAFLARQQKQEPGLRADAGKVRWDLLPFDALHQVARVSTFGAEEYAPRNWERGMSWSRMVGSLMRHLYARMCGERLDPKSRLPHTAHLAWNALALCAYDLRDVGPNDLPELVYGPGRDAPDD